MSGYIKDNLLKDETCLFMTRPSLVVLFLPTLFCVLSLLGLFFFPIVKELFLILLIFACGYGAMSSMTVFFSEFAVTNNRLFAKRGLLNIKTISVPFTKIETVDYQQSLTGRILNYGTVIVTGAGGTHDVFPQVHSPVAFRRAIQGQLSVRS